MLVSSNLTVVVRFAVFFAVFLSFETLEILFYLLAFIVFFLFFFALSGIVLPVWVDTVTKVSSLTLLVRFFLWFSTISSPWGECVGTVL